MLKELDNGTMFTAQRFFRHVDEASNQAEIRETVGVWAWETVKSVQTIPTNSFPEIQGPSCMVEQAEGYIYLRVEYQQMQRAYRVWRQRYGPQPIRFLAN